MRFLIYDLRLAIYAARLLNEPPAYVIPMSAD